MADDWIITGSNCPRTRADFLSWLTSGDFTHEAFGRVDTPRVRVYGDTAVLTVRVVNNGHYQGEPFTADEWTTDVFVKQKGRWLCVASHITAVED